MPRKVAQLNTKISWVPRTQVSEGRAERHNARRLGQDGVQGLGQVVLHEVPLQNVLAGERLGTHGARVRAVVGLRG